MPGYPQPVLWPFRSWGGAWRRGTTPVTLHRLTRPHEAAAAIGPPRGRPRFRRPVPGRYRVRTPPESSEARPILPVRQAHRTSRRHGASACSRRGNAGRHPRPADYRSASAGRGRRIGHQQPRAGGLPLPLPASPDQNRRCPAPPALDADGVPNPADEPRLIPHVRPGVAAAVARHLDVILHAWEVAGTVI